MDFHDLLLFILVFCIAVSLGYFLVSRAKRLFLFVKPEMLRRNIVTYLIGLCFFFALGHLIPDFRNIINDFGWGKGMLLFAVIVFFNVLVPYNIVIYINENPRFIPMGSIKQQVLIFSGIVLTTIIANGLMNFLINNSTRYLKYSIVWSFYMSGLAALVYLFVRQTDLEKKKKLYEKELELARLNELKTKAELDALHSKINPHFLYNALNSIADLAVTDGKKARQMTISLADLFRYSINYGDRNFTTIKEELEIVELYLGIEKTRFEDKLVYSVKSENNTLSCLVPKFILQPLVENAVKHGLKRTNQLTQINIEVSFEQNPIPERNFLIIKIYDNGPPFPDKLEPGYGLKTVYDKLNLLFPGNYEIQMKNEPQKFVLIRLYNPLKNEPDA